MTGCPSSLLAASVHPLHQLPDDAVGVGHLEVALAPRLGVDRRHDVDALVLLTDVDGLYTDRPGRPGARRIDLVDDPAILEQIEIGGTGSSVGSGGMATKVEAATIANAAGIPTVLTSTPTVEARPCLLYL